MLAFERARCPILASVSASFALPPKSWYGSARSFLAFCGLESDPAVGLFRGRLALALGGPEESRVLLLMGCLELNGTAAQVLGLLVFLAHQ